MKKIFLPKISLREDTDFRGYKETIKEPVLVLNSYIQDLDKGTDKEYFIEIDPTMRYMGEVYFCVEDTHSGIVRKGFDLFLYLPEKWVLEETPYGNITIMDKTYYIYSFVNLRE